MLFRSVDSLFQLSPRVSLSLEGGATVYQFDHNGTVARTPDQTSYYGAVSVRHKPSELFSQTLRAGRDLQLGITSDVLELWAVRYQADVRITQYTSMTPRLFYEHGEELKTAGAERFNRFGVGVTFTRQLSEHLRAGLGYNFTLKDSDLAGRSYKQNGVVLDVTYRF